jgi:cell wall-associated NlpC family hydrolase
VAHASRNHAARALTALCLGATGATILTAAPAIADDVDQAQAKVDHLSHDRKAVVKKVTTTRKSLAAARLDLAVTQAELRSYRAALVEVQDRVQAMQDDEGSSIGRALTAASEVTTAPDPAEALDAVQEELTEDSHAPETAEALQDRLAQLSATSTRQETRIRVLTTRAQQSGHHLRDLKASLSRAYAALQDARAAARAEAEKAQQAQQAEQATGPAVSGGAAGAVAYAMAQVGDAYVYGAAGPDAYDCSGLTMAAWGAAGVALPHSSGAQMGSGTPVSIDALQPGDLVFYYSPVSHVAMYIGNGQIVHAANPSSGVMVSSVSSMPISGAVRPG